MSAGFYELERRIDYEFRDTGLLRRALTHRSSVGGAGPKPASNGQISDNEQLEFLGDSILGFIASENLVRRHPAVREGQLSKWKAHLVSAAHLHQCALILGLGEYLVLGKGEERSGGRERKTVLANALEALIAAIYLDGGMEPARKFVQTRILAALDSPEHVSRLGTLNYKSLLQEKTQALGLPVPRYAIVETNGPEHAKVFTIEARVGNRLTTRAQGTSKKEASQSAAQMLVEQLEAAIEKP